jgi:predicted P-loop ATPase
MYTNLNIENIENEIWVDIKDFEGMYQVSNFGRFKSLSRMKRLGKHGMRLMDGFIMKQNERKGYLSILLYKSDDYKAKFPSHVLVAKHFIDIENKRTVNHINGCKKDNRVENLEWLSDSEQQIHAVSIGLRDNTIGEKSNFSKLNEMIVLEIRDLFKKSVSAKELSKMYNISQNNIYMITNRITWKHI